MSDFKRSIARQYLLLALENHDKGEYALRDMYFARVNKMYVDGVDFNELTRHEVENDDSLL